MKFSLPSLNLMRVALAGVAVSLLASCGGGDQIEKFVPDRIIVFGDEASVIDDSATANQGLKYTVNGIGRNTDGTLNGTRDCTRNPIWVQVLANDYGYVFDECRAAGVTPRAFMRAANGSTAADVRAAITAYMASPGFTDRDLVTIMVGTHDVLAAAALATPELAIAAAEAAGNMVGEEVIRVTNRGARVLVSTIPDVSTTPDGRLSPQATLLQTLTQRFNARLRVKLQEVRGGGHSAGLVLGDELVLVILRSPSGYGISNTVQAVCTPALFSCDEQTGLVPEAVTTGNRGNDWLWAGPYQLGANAQSRLGSAAVYRARNNPF